MKKLFALILALALALSLAACGGNDSGSGSKSGDINPAANNGNDTSQTTTAPPGNGGSGAAAGAFTSVNDMLGASQDLYKLFERLINSYDEPIDLLIGNGLAALVGYQINNDLSDADGTFGDKNSEHGTYTKQGDQITIAVDYTYEAASFGHEEGDHIVSNGAADLSAGSAWCETSTERAGALISKNRYDYLFKNGVLIALEQSFTDVDVTGRDDKSNTVKCIVIDGNSYQFAVGTATTGVAQPFITFDAAKDTAAMKTAIQDTGYTIKYFGNVSDDKLNLQ